MRIRGNEQRWGGVSSFCSIPLLWRTSPKYLDTVKLMHLYGKPKLHAISTTLRLFLSLALSALSPHLCLAVQFCKVISWYNTTKKKGKGVFTLKSSESGDEHWLHCHSSLLLFLWTARVIDLPACFCKSCQFVFTAPSSQVVQFWIHKKINEEGWLKRWPNKCLDCHSSATWTEV